MRRGWNNTFLIFTLSLFFSFNILAKGSSPPKLPNTGGEVNNDILQKYDYVDPGQLINRVPLSRALEYYDQNKSSIDNTDYLSVIDFSKHSNLRRFYVIDMRSGQVEAIKTSHGKNSDSNNDGYADKFSNTANSKMSSLGFYQAAETYIGKHGYSMRLDGLSSTNSNARSRAIVIHPADYVDEDGSWTGRSWGCPAIDPELSSRIIDYIKEGSIIYAWTE